MRVGDSVTVHPNASLRFGGQTGKIETIQDNIIYVIMDFTEFKLEFSKDELLDENGYFSFLHNFCVVCDKFQNKICADCAEVEFNGRDF